MSKVDLLYSEYTLGGKSFSKQGVLLRLESEGQRYYACLQNWENLDNKSQKQITDFIHSGSGLQDSFFRSALLQGFRYGSFDTEIRSEVASHITLGTQKDLNDEALVKVIEGGFKAAKIKVHEDLGLSLLDIFHWAHISPPEIKLRLDFNLKFSKEEVVRALGKLSEEELERLDFIEDPFSGSLEEWLWVQEEFQVVLASDWYYPESNRFPGDEAKKSYPLLEVLKPNIKQKSFSSFKETTNLVVSSYLAHPLEQLLCLQYANELSRQAENCEVMGAFCSHYSFDRNPYSNLFKVDQGHLVLEDYDHWNRLLEKEPWKKGCSFEKQDLLG